MQVRLGGALDGPTPVFDSLVIFTNYESHNRGYVYRFRPVWHSNYRIPQFMSRTRWMSPNLRISNLPQDSLAAGDPITHFCHEMRRSLKARIQIFCQYEWSVAICQSMPGKLNGS
jgi:hypothetical protein